MSHRKGLIVAPINVASDVGEVLGTGSGDVGTNCTSSNINISSKYKPTDSIGYSTPTVFNYALDVNGSLSEEDLVTIANRTDGGWTYRGPNSTISTTKYYRILDFNGYYHNAPCPLEQVNGDELTIDLVSGRNASATFYILLKNGRMANMNNKVPQTEIVNGITYNYSASCLYIDQDSIFLAGGQTFNNLLGGELGLIIYNTDLTSKKASKYCSMAISNTVTQIENNMYILPLNDLWTSPYNLPLGNYKAIACVRKERDGLGYAYFPVGSTRLNPSIFTLKLGGLDNYWYTWDGVALSNTDTPTFSLTTTSNDLYIFIKFKNESGGSLTVGHGANSKFFLTAVVSGTIEDHNGPGQNINRPQDTEYVYDNINSISNQADIIIANGNTGYLVFKLTNIWSNSETSSPTGIVSGSVTISPTLKFNNINTYTSHLPSVREITITYGVPGF